MTNIFIFFMGFAACAVVIGGWKRVFPENTMGGITPFASDKADWTPEEALRFYAEGQHFEIIDHKTHIIDTGAVASNALKSMSMAYAIKKGDVALGDPLSGLVVETFRTEWGSGKERP